MQLNLELTILCATILIILLIIDLMKRKKPSDKIKKNVNSSLSKGILTALITGGTVADACLNGGAVAIVNGICQMLYD